MNLAESSRKYGGKTLRDQERFDRKVRNGRREDIDTTKTMHDTTRKYDFTKNGVKAMGMAGKFGCAYDLHDDGRHTIDNTTNPNRVCRREMKRKEAEFAKKDLDDQLADNRLESITYDIGIWRDNMISSNEDLPPRPIPEPPHHYEGIDDKWLQTITDKMAAAYIESENIDCNDIVSMIWKAVQGPMSPVTNNKRSIRYMSPKYASNPNLLVRIVALETMWKIKSDYDKFDKMERITRVPGFGGYNTYNGNPDNGKPKVYDEQGKFDKFKE